MEVLKQIFGPNKKEIWSQLSKEIGAEYKEGGFFKESKVVLKHNEWEITLDTYSVHANTAHMVFTRMRAPYLNKDGFKFNIYKKSVFSWLGKLFGVQDIELGDSYFDEDFIIQGEPESMVFKLLSNRKIKQLIQKQPDIHLQIKDDEGWFAQKFPDGVDELYFQTKGVVKDEVRLKELFELFALVLDELCKMGSAYKNGPGIKIK